MSRRLCTLTLVVALYLSLPKPSGRAEDRLDYKFLWYQEHDDRMRVWAPAFFFERELSSVWNLKIDGVYNAISGATPTGAPRSMRVTTQAVGPAAPSPPPAGGGGGDGEDDDEEHGRFGTLLRPGSAGRFHARTGATNLPAPAPVPAGGGIAETYATLSDLPLQEIEDERFGLNAELARKVSRFTTRGKLSLSTEGDFTSVGLALGEDIEFNRRNTTLTTAVAYTHDMIDLFYEDGTDTRDTVDLLVGVTQVLTPRTLLVANLSAGALNGFLADPYKVVELNGVLVPERRPDSKTKQILYLGLRQHVASLAGSLEAGWRLYQDSFGIRANTLDLGWYQKLGTRFALEPLIRFYDQDEADFYAVRFSGAPAEYSADYRLSALQSTSYGARLFWFPTARSSLDISYERYEQRGKDGETDDAVYPVADVIMVGGRLWF